MKSVRLVLLVVVTLSIAAGCDKPATEVPGQAQISTAASPQASVATDEFVATRAIFKDNCVKCHGENAAGGRVQVEGKEIKVPNLTGEHARKPTDEKLATKITEGDDEMPAFKDKLTPEQIQDLVRFIREEFQGR